MAGLGQLFGWARSRLTSGAPELLTDASADPTALAYYGTRILVERHAELFPGAAETLRRTGHVASRGAKLPPAFRSANRIVVGDVLWSVEGWRAAAEVYRQMLTARGEPIELEEWQMLGAAFWVWLRCRYSALDTLAHGIRFFEMKRFLIEYREALIDEGLVLVSWDTAPHDLVAILASAPFTAVQPPARRALARVGVPFRFDYAAITAALRERLVIPTYRASAQRPHATARSITAGVRSSPQTAPRAG